jgi:uncharacterized small protein (DUF1192 family)
VHKRLPTARNQPDKSSTEVKMKADALESSLQSIAADDIDARISLLQSYFNQLKATS